MADAVTAMRSRNSMTDRNIKGISAFVTLALIEKYFLLGNIFLNSRSGISDRYL
jgi:hypothetical protein